jgi:hypothetical protein
VRAVQDRIKRYGIFFSSFHFICYGHIDSLTLHILLTGKYKRRDPGTIDKKSKIYEKLTVSSEDIAAQNRALQLAKRKEMILKLGKKASLTKLCSDENESTRPFDDENMGEISDR